MAGGIFSLCPAPTGRHCSDSQRGPSFRSLTLILTHGTVQDVPCRAWLLSLNTSTQRIHADRGNRMSQAPRREQRAVEHARRAGGELVAKAAGTMGFSGNSV